MAGFEFRYRLGGGAPTIRTGTVGDGADVQPGDLLQLEHRWLRRALPGDRALVGVAIEAVADGDAGRTVRVIIDGDAVYAVADPRRRTAAEPLALGDAGAVDPEAAGPDSELIVVADSSAEADTLVRISPGASSASTSAVSACCRCAARAVRNRSGSRS